MGRLTPRRDDRELIAGTLDMLILHALCRGPAHGYAIARFIEDASEDVLAVEEGALYPALHKLEVRGEVRSQWGASQNNRRAKFYQLTVLGRRALRTEASQWRRLSGAVTRVIETV
jgi:PadR family transcriptional regulator PadR